MAKDKKKKPAAAEPRDGAAQAVEAVRGAVERTFQATAGGRSRAQELVDEIASAATRVRDALDELNLLEEVRGLRREVDELRRRVEALEGQGRRTPGTATAGRPVPTTTADDASEGRS